MKNPQENEMRFILSVLKSPEKEYNANNLAKHLNMSSMGVLKIAKRLEKQDIISFREVGKAKIYSINLDSDYARQYVKLLLKKETENASSYVRRWIKELNKIKSAKAVILFGSVLKKEKEARDIDVLAIIDKKGFEKAKKEIEEINSLNEKKIHPVYQTKEDLRKHINERDKVILNALKGIVVVGEDIIIENLK